MKKVTKLLSLLLAAAMCLALAACGGGSTASTSAAPAGGEASGSAAGSAAPAASGDALKVGGVFNITGDQASLDEPEQKGFDLAVEVINKEGGINGRKVEAVYYDGQTDQTVCANNAKKLIDSDKVLAIAGLSDSDYAYAAGAPAQAAGVPIVFSGATTPDIPATVGNCAFLTAIGDDVNAHAAATYFAKEKKAKTAYVLTDKSMSYTTNLSNYFIEKFKELGGEVVLQDYFSSGDHDFSAQISRYMALGKEADVMFMATGPDDASTVIEQFRSGGAKAPMISGDGWDTDLWGVAGDLANQDVYVCTHYSADDQSEKVQNFIKAYTDKYGKAPENAFAPLGYDSAMVIFKAIEMCGDDVTSANIRDNLEKIEKLEGITGTITYSKDNHVPEKSVVVTKAEEGALKFVVNY